MTTAVLSTGQLLALSLPAILLGVAWLWRSRPPLPTTALLGVLIPVVAYALVRLVALPLANLVRLAGW